jgi:hypothetical protein
MAKWPIKAGAGLTGSSCSKRLENVSLIMRRRALGGLEGSTYVSYSVCCWYLDIVERVKTEDIVRAPSCIRSRESFGQMLFQIFNGCSEYLERWPAVAVTI